ncbi:MAG TPA: hypothetical protein VFU40_00600, partial [Gemmatimonadales bacterium]|nr:hypothetical protein [Gemmatimonadales bacterium]
SAAWANTCRKLVVTLMDGTRHEALFRFVAASPQPLARPREPQSEPPPVNVSKPGGRRKLS